MMVEDNGVVLPVEPTETQPLPGPEAAAVGIAEKGLRPEGDVAGALELLADGAAVEGRVEAEGSRESVMMQVAEAAYVRENGEKWDGLATRYESEQTGFAYTMDQVREYVNDHCKPYEEDTNEALIIGQIERYIGGNKAFDEDTRKLVEERVGLEVKRLLADKERGRNNPEKQRLVLEQSHRYLDLLILAQSQEDVGKLQATVVMQLVMDNVHKLAFQDRVASENTLGDHGVRHLVGHNIRFAEATLSALENQGQEVRAIDRLILHQVMIDHDIGYAMKPVRDEVNKGKSAADRGHNVLAAKFVREQASDASSTLAQVFSSEQLAGIHEGILHHDSSEVDFTVTSAEETEEEKARIRKVNRESAIHLADNTHAFEDKLPEVLYDNAESLLYMRLLKTAGEIGDNKVLDKVRGRLTQSIQDRNDLADDDKIALTQAARLLTAQGYWSLVGRICGNKPEVTVNEQGQVAVRVQESVIHQEVVRLFDMNAYERLVKFVRDLTGSGDLSEVRRQLVEGRKIEANSGKLVIEVATGEAKASKKTDYQEQLDRLIDNEDFRNFVNADKALSLAQKVLEQELEYTGQLGLSEDERKQKQQAIIDDIKNQRKNLLSTYMNG